MSLGRFISERRKRLKMTQEELAAVMNVSKSAVAKWETDGGIPDRDNIRRLSEVLGISVVSLERIIDADAGIESCEDINITQDIIRLLEVRGFVVTRKKDEKKDEQ